jgi:hypothetical protein
MEFVQKDSVNSIIHYKDRFLLEWHDDLILYGGINIICGLFPHEYMYFIYEGESIMCFNSGEITAFSWLYDFYRGLRDKITGKVSFENVTESDIRHLLELSNVLDDMCTQLDEECEHLADLVDDTCENCIMNDCATCEEAKNIVRQILLRRPTAAKSARN